MANTVAGAMTAPGLEMWTVYEHPADYPDSYVVRRSVVRSSREGGIELGEAWAAPTLDAVRKFIPPGLYRQVRAPDDDPVIVEAWF